MKRIGFLGPKGTFSQEAMNVYAKENGGGEGITYNTITELIVAVSNSEIDEAIVPIENSLEGAVSATMDMLVADNNIRIVAEMVIAINQNLLVKRERVLRI